MFNDFIDYFSRLSKRRKVLLFLAASLLCLGSLFFSAGSGAKPSSDREVQGFENAVSTTAEGELRPGRIRRSLSAEEKSMLLEQNVLAIDLRSRDEREKREESTEPSTMTLREDWLQELRLLGTLASGGGGWAIIQDLKQGQEELYKPGEELRDGLRLAVVERSRVLLKWDGGLGELRMDGKEKSPQGYEPERPERKKTVRYSKQELRAEVEDLRRLFSQIRFAPYFEKGRQRGFKILSVRRASFPSKLGAKAGDIVRAVNGKELQSVRSAFELFQELKDSPSIEISLLRKGRPFKIEILQD